MGKSLKNSVTPDDLYDAYGADTMRLYEMSMGPLEQSRPWETRAVVGMYRFLQRVWRNLVDEETGALRVVDEPADDETRRLLHRTIAAVRADMDGLRFNTAIAKLIELNNHLVGRDVPREVAEPLVLMLAPLAPHVAEELWARLGHDRSLAYEAFPEADPALLVEDTQSSTRCRSTARCGPMWSWPRGPTPPRWRRPPWPIRRWWRRWAGPRPSGSSSCPAGSSTSWSRT